MSGATADARGRRAAPDETRHASHDKPLEVGGLPSIGFGAQALTWWGLWGLIAIEGTVFALAIGAYFYLESHATIWPLYSPPPDLLWGTINTAILLISLVPNQVAKAGAERMDLRMTRLGIVMGLVLSLAFLTIRVFEFGSLNCRWDTDAYGSIVWTLLALHTMHLVTDVYDSVVLGLMFYTGPIEGKRFVDASENSLYWYFVVIAWIPIYLVIYWMPRWH